MYVEERRVRHLSCHANEEERRLYRQINRPSRKTRYETPSTAKQEANKQQMRSRGWTGEDAAKNIRKKNARRQVLVLERRRGERGRLSIRDKRQGKRVTRHALYMRFTETRAKQNSKHTA